jgi:hypothetical protein
MVPLWLDIKGCALFIFVRAVDHDNNSQSSSFFQAAFTFGFFVKQETISGFPF